MGQVWAVKELRLTQYVVFKEVHDLDSSIPLTLAAIALALVSVGTSCDSLECQSQVNRNAEQRKP